MLERLRGHKVFYNHLRIAELEALKETLADLSRTLQYLRKVEDEKN
jgi:hypothetical protein